MAILSYLGFLVLVPILTGAHKTSPFVKYHANQGLVLFLVYIAWGIVNAILAAILSAILISSIYSPGAWGLYGILTTILGLVWIIPVVFAIMGLINAGSGKIKPLPLIGKITLLK